MNILLWMTITALSGFILFIAINTLFSFAYMYIQRGLDLIQDPAAYSKVSLTFYAKKCCQEFYYVMGKYYLYPLKFLNLNIKPAATTSKTAILLIHGFARNQSDWLWFRKQLRHSGLPIYLVNLKPEFASVETITKNSLPGVIARIKQETNCEKIILIGHSMGGLVASYYSEYLDQDNLIAKVIAIGTPFHGTNLALAAAGENGKQMCPYSSFCKDLISKINNSQKSYYQIATQFDNLVSPWHSSILKSTPQSQQLILAYESHLALLHSKIVLHQVITWIATS